MYHAPKIILLRGTISCTKTIDFMSTSGSGFHRYEHILTEGRNFKTLLKESYAFALDCCYVFTKKMLKMEN